MDQASDQRLRKLGIVGGLGPAATAYLFSKVVDLTDASCDADHLDVTVLNRPQVPDRTAYLLGRSSEDFAPALAATVEDLVTLGCEVICIACVTAHAAFSRLEDAAARRAEALELPTPAMLNLPAEIAAELSRRTCRRVGLLGTEGTVKTGILQRAVEARGIEVCLPDAQRENLVMGLIYDDIKAGRPANMEAFEQVCAYFAGKGCDSVMLGCTELPLIGAPQHCQGMYVASSLDILARAAVLACGAKVRRER